MENDNIIDLLSRDTISDTISDLDHAGVVRNGYLLERSAQTGTDPVSVWIPKVSAKDGEPVTFSSTLVPSYVRKKRSLEATIPWLYLKGVSSGEMGEVLQVLVGPEARGLSAITISRLKEEWVAKYNCRRKERVDDVE